MRLVQRGDVWLLIDEAAPESACVIAVMRDEVEVLALHEFCRAYLQRPGGVPERFTVRCGDAEYTVTPLGTPGEKLSLVIRGEGYSSTLGTEFRMGDSNAT
jgi:hypothetical protein